MSAATRTIQESPGPPKNKTRRKADLEAPRCRENCQINHNIQQAAALLQVSPWQVRQLIECGRLAAMNISAGEGKKYLRIPHASIGKLLVTDGQ